jgi:hypothetical protein
MKKKVRKGEKNKLIKMYLKKTRINEFRVDTLQCVYRYEVKHVREIQGIGGTVEAHVTRDEDDEAPTPRGLCVDR